MIAVILAFLFFIILPLIVIIGFWQQSIALGIFCIIYFMLLFCAIWKESR